MKTYELPMTRSYVRHWGVAKAVQELLQNAIDSSAPFEHEFAEGAKGKTTLHITSRGITLPATTLLLGSTSKAEDDSSIGSFGEGYKIALLVLTRLGYTVVVRNGDKLWCPEFRMSETFGDEVLVIDEHELTGREEHSLTFTVGGLSDEDVIAISSSCLQMQDLENVHGAVVKCPQGRILSNRPGKLYVNGLFVCDTEFKYGYDVKPEYLKLERDRQTVSAFDLAWVTKEMWFSTGKSELIASLIADGCADLKYANYGAPEKVKKACVDHFFGLNGEDAVTAGTPEEARVMKDAGVATAVYHNSTMHACVTESTAYKQPPTIIDITTPKAQLERWYNKNKRYMSRLPSANFKKLLQESANWSKK